MGLPPLVCVETGTLAGILPAFLALLYASTQAWGSLVGSTLSGKPAAHSRARGAGMKRSVARLVEGNTYRWNR